MSYWTSLEIDTGGPEPVTVDEEPGNHTSNTSPMWRRALEAAGRDGGLRSLHGVVAEDAVGVLAEAVVHMSRNCDQYQEMNPANGWGDYDSALDYLMRLAAACKRHPRATIRVSC